MPRLRDGTRCADDLVEALLEAGNAFVAITARSLASVDEGVTLAQYRALVELGQDHSRVVDLARALGVNRSTATRMSDRLAHKRLLTRRRLRADRRVVSLSLTETGRTLVEEVSRRRRARVAEIVSGLPQTDPESVVGSLRAFAHAASESPTARSALDPGSRR